MGTRLNFEQRTDVSAATGGPAVCTPLYLRPSPHTGHCLNTTLGNQIEYCTMATTLVWGLTRLLRPGCAVQDPSGPQEDDTDGLHVDLAASSLSQ